MLSASCTDDPADASIGVQLDMLHLLEASMLRGFVQCHGCSHTGPLGSANLIAPQCDSVWVATKHGALILFVTCLFAIMTNDVGACREA